MGVQKNLAQANKDLESLKKLIEKPDVIAARKAIDAVKKLLADTTKAAAEKQKKGDEGIRKLAEAVNACVTIADKRPFDGAKAVDLIKQATAAAAAAVQSAAPVT